MGKKVPLFYYQTNGERIEVGEVEVDDSGTDRVTAINVDTEAIAKINGELDFKSFTILSHEESPEKRNVFDQPKD